MQTTRYEGTFQHDDDGEGPERERVMCGVRAAELIGVNLLPSSPPRPGTTARTSAGRRAQMEGCQDVKGRALQAVLLDPGNGAFKQVATIVGAGSAGAITMSAGSGGVRGHSAPTLEIHPRRVALMSAFT